MGESAGFLNIFRTLLWFFGAMDIFENWASGSLFPALMLSSTLCSGQSPTKIHEESACSSSGVLSVEWLPYNKKYSQSNGGLSSGFDYWLVLGKRGKKGSKDQRICEEGTRTGIKVRSHLPIDPNVLYPTASNPVDFLL